VSLVTWKKEDKIQTRILVPIHCSMVTPITIHLNFLIGCRFMQIVSLPIIYLYLFLILRSAPKTDLPGHIFEVMPASSVLM